MGQSLATERKIGQVQEEPNGNIGSNMNMNMNFENCENCESRMVSRNRSGVPGVINQVENYTNPQSRHLRTTASVVEPLGSNSDEYNTTLVEAENASRSVDFNRSLGFYHFYKRFITKEANMDFADGYELASVKYQSLDRNVKDKYRRKSSKTNSKKSKRRSYNDMRLEDILDGDDYDWQYLPIDLDEYTKFDVDEEDFDLTNLKDAFKFNDTPRRKWNRMEDGCGCKKQKCGCGGKDCPKKPSSKNCVEPGTCDSIGFKNFLADFRCKNDHLSRCTGLAQAKCIYGGMDECAKKKYRAMGCVPPRCRKECIPFVPITNAKRRPKCKPCGF